MGSGTMRTSLSAVMALWIALAAGPALAQRSDAGEPTAASLVGRPDDQRLVDALTRFGMTELREALPPAAAEDALAAEVDVENLRRRLLNPPSRRDPDALAEYYGAWLTLADAIGNRRVAPHAQRMLYLMAGPEDFRAVRAGCEESLESFDELLRSLRYEIESMEDDWDMLALGGPGKLAGIERVARYKSAWVRLHLALALGADRPGRGLTSRQQRLLEDAYNSASPFAEGDARSGVRDWSLLLQAMAADALGNSGSAERLLLGLTGGETAPDTRMQALFELAKHYTRVGRWDRAEAAIGAYRRVGETMSPAEAMQGLELKEALLRENLLLARGLSVRDSDPGESAEYLNESQRVIAGLLRRHWNRREAFATVLGRRFGAYIVMDKAPETVLYCTAAALLNGDPPQKERAAEALAELVSRSGATADLFRPDAAWKLGQIQYELAEDAADPSKRRRAAARAYLLLAREAPQDERARRAARNAVVLLEGLARQADAGGEDGQRDAHEKLAEALSLLLARWPAEDDDGALRFLLARQWEWLDRPKRAVESYHLVPESSPDFLAAQSNALALTARATLDSEEAASSEAALDLARRWLDLSGVASDRARSVDEPRRRAAARAVAAQAQLNAAEIYAGRVGRLEEADRILREFAPRWPDQPDTARRAEALRIRLLLTREQTDQAVEAVREFRRVYGDKSHALIAQAAVEARERLVALERRARPGDELEHWRRAYAEFARIAWEDAKDLPANQRLPYRLMAAEAMAETGRAGEALYELESIRREHPREASVLSAQARAYWLAERHDEAIVLYRRIVNGLDPQIDPDRWWLAQLRMCRCALDAAREDTALAKPLLVRLRQLRRRDSDFGGLLPAFNEVERRAAELPGE